MRQLLDMRLVQVLEEELGSDYRRSRRSMASSQSNRHRTALSRHVVQSVYGRTPEREHHVYVGDFDQRQPE